MLDTVAFKQGRAMQTSTRQLRASPSLGLAMRPATLMLAGWADSTSPSPSAPSFPRLPRASLPADTRVAVAAAVAFAPEAATAFRSSAAALAVTSWRVRERASKKQKNTAELMPLEMARGPMPGGWG